MPEALKASPELLEKTLGRRPVLWVGAGLSVAAGLPSTDHLVRAMVQDADHPIDSSLPFERVADAYVESMGSGSLGDLLQTLLAEPTQVTAAHRAIARAASEGQFEAIVTTNYDDLLERALADAEVRIVEQPLEDNATVNDPSAVRLLKLHGSREDWRNVVLSGESYARFSATYPYLQSQLMRLLRTFPVLFVGCSMQDPRILQWLEGLEDEARRDLKPWRTLVRSDAWDEAVAKGPILETARVVPLLLDSHDHLQRLWVETVPERAPEGEIAIDVMVCGEGLKASCCGEIWEPDNPLDDPRWMDVVEDLQRYGTRPLPADDHGVLAPDAAGAAAKLNQLAVRVGDRLTAFLADSVVEKLRTLEAAARLGTPALVRLRVAAESEAAKSVADRLLALPWEMLRIADRFPVKQYTFDLVREAVVDDLPGLDEPASELKVVATVAAPVDQVQLDTEGEMYRLWRALGAQDEGRLHVADLGTLQDFTEAVRQHEPTAVHFTGHGTPGALIFEDEAARDHKVEVDELVQRLHVLQAPLPRLIYLSACHGTTVGQGAAAAGTTVRTGDEDTAAREGDRQFDGAAVSTQPSTAATLHRGGFPQVVGYFGPVGDMQATRTAAAFYAELARGATARAGLRRARDEANQKLRLGDGWGVYPLGWAQLALYHRGDDHPTALASVESKTFYDAPRQRVFVPLNKTGGSERLERRHDEPIVGVQQLRHGFIGRRAPRAEAIGRWRRGQRTLVVHGLGGLGKTALCTELLRVLPEGKVVALDGRFAGSQPDPIAALWREIEAARPGDERWSSALGQLQKDGLDAAALVRAFQVLHQIEGGLTVYLDDAESLQEEITEGAELGRWVDEGVRSWWKGMVQLAEDFGSFGLIASSRYRPEATPSKALLALEPMSRWETLRLMTWMPTLRQMPHSDRDWLTKRLEGHPRTIEWLEVLARDKVDSVAGGAFSGDWRSTILEPILEEAGEKIDADLLLGQIWRVLGDETREHLGRASVLRAPVPWPAVLALMDGEGGASANRLRDSGLLSPFQSPEKNPWWAPHRLVSKKVSELWRGDAKAAHLRLGVWFQERFEEESSVANAQRSVEHLCEAGEGDLAFPTAQSLMLWLRDAGRYREALGWVERVQDAGATEHRKGLLSCTRFNCSALLARSQSMARCSSFVRWN